MCVFGDSVFNLAIFDDDRFVGLVVLCNNRLACRIGWVLGIHFLTIMIFCCLGIGARSQCQQTYD